MRFKEKSSQELEHQFSKVSAMCPDVFDSIESGAERQPVSFLRAKYHSEYQVYLSLLRHLGKKNRLIEQEPETPEVLDNGQLQEQAVDSPERVPEGYFTTSLLAEVLGTDKYVFLEFVRENFSLEDHPSVHIYRCGKRGQTISFDRLLAQRVISLYASFNPDKFIDEKGLLAIADHMEISVETLWEQSDHGWLMRTIFSVPSDDVDVKIIIRKDHIPRGPIVGEHWVGRTKLLQEAETTLKAEYPDLVVDVLISLFAPEFKGKSGFGKGSDGKAVDMLVSPSYAARIRAEINELKDYMDVAALQKLFPGSHLEHSLLDRYQAAYPAMVRTYSNGKGIAKQFNLYHPDIQEFIAMEREKENEARGQSTEKSDDVLALFSKPPWDWSYLRQLGVSKNVPNVFSHLTHLLNIEWGCPIGDAEEDKIKRWIDEVKTWETAFSFVQRFSFPINDAKAALFFDRYSRHADATSSVIFFGVNLHDIYLAPAFVADLAAKMDIPEGWVAVDLLLHHYGNDPGTQETLQLSREKFPDQFREFLSTENMLMQEFVGPVAGDFFTNSVAVGNEFTMYKNIDDLVLAYDRPASLLLDVIKFLITLDHQPVRKYVGGKFITCYGPEITSQIERYLPPPSEYWMTAEQIAESSDLTREQVIRRSKILKGTGQKFYNARKRETELYYAPELAEQILNGDFAPTSSGMRN